MLSDLFAQLGIEGWKPVLSALLLPPVPFLLLMLAGATLARRRPSGAWLLLLTGAAGIWLSSTAVFGEWLQRQLLSPLHALAREDLSDLQSTRKGIASAIVVLGGGRDSHAPEYGGNNLSHQSMERLRYGLWLARETGLTLVFSGGSGHAQPEGPSEAEIAAQIAVREFGRKLTWTENRSRDTRENAARTVAMLQAAGIQRIVLVTHGEGGDDEARPARDQDFCMTTARSLLSVQVRKGPIARRLYRASRAGDHLVGHPWARELRSAAHARLGRCGPGNTNPLEAVGPRGWAG